MKQYQRADMEIINIVPLDAGRFSKYCVISPGQGEIDSGPVLDNCTSDFCWDEWGEAD